ncbi:MAG TPA: hypothetical protein VEX38_01175, partial [Fimbriimonadaceae bacterium]|nr:hypothetical protein [Fimbriimonadaceae bacterium]
MKSSRGLPLIAYILLGLLALSFALLSLGRRESVAEPSADSYGPSGASAFAELLRKQGHRVRVSTRKNPELLSSDLVIAFYVRHEPTWSDLGIKSPDELEEEIEVPGRAALERHLNGGGKALVLELDQGFREASRIGISGQTKLTNVVDGTVRRVSKLDGLEPTDFAEDWISTLWIDESEAALVHGREQGRGLVVHANAGLLGTNRFIARDDNAAFLLGLVSSLAPPKSQIVFHEAYWGRIVEPSLMELLGPWAQAAWTQILVLFVI